MNEKYFPKRSGREHLRKGLEPIEWIVGGRDWSPCTLMMYGFEFSGHFRQRDKAPKIILSMTVHKVWYLI